MKKVMFVVACVVALGLVGSAQAADYPLYAGQDMPVGYVEVTDNGATMTVKYVIDDSDWCITETHLAIEQLLADIPQTKKNNPIPGKFEFNDSWNCVPDVTYTKDVSDETMYYVAAHAVVYDTTSGETLTLVSDPSVAVTEVNGQPMAQNAVEAYEPNGYPKCSTMTLADNIISLWDQGIGGNSATFTAAGADWIWNAPNPERVILGDAVTFQKTFACVAPTGGSILITADNGYAVTLNGTFIGSAQLFAAFPGSLKQDGVDTTNWQSVETWGLSGFLNGENTLMIVAANEYFFGDDPPNFDFSGTGIGGLPAGDGRDNDCYNPGALIFKATVEGCLTEHETAWGDGCSFDGNQWGTYFTYTTSE